METGKGTYDAFFRDRIQFLYKDLKSPIMENTINKSLTHLLPTLKRHWDLQNSDWGRDECSQTNDLEFLLKRALLIWILLVGAYAKLHLREQGLCIAVDPALEVLAL